MRLAYVAPLNPETNPGIARKIAAQQKAFERAGIECDLLYMSAHQVVPWTYLLQRLPVVGTDWVSWDEIDPARYDAFYIRRPLFVSRQFLSFLRRLRKVRPAAPVVYEVPTWPYDQEMLNIHRIPLLAKDLHNRRQLKRYVDVVADLEGEERILSLPTVEFFNGVDLDAVGMREPAGAVEGVELAFACTFYPWHGVDRMIAGLADYMDAGGERPVRLHLMGDGPELERCRALAEERGISGHVEFLGMLDAAQMDEVYARCTFAMSSLGLYRIGIENSTTLKTNEYLAKGLPFAYGGTIAVFERDPVDFCLQVPNDDSPLDVGAVVAFHDALYAREDALSLTRRIRAYAEEHVSIDAGMAEVVAYLKDNAAEGRV